MTLAKPIKFNIIQNLKKVIGGTLVKSNLKEVPIGVALMPFSSFWKT